MIIELLAIKGFTSCFSSKPPPPNAPSSSGGDTDHEGERRHRNYARKWEADAREYCKEHNMPYLSAPPPVPAAFLPAPVPAEPSLGWRIICVLFWVFMIASFICALVE